MSEDLNRLGIREPERHGVKPPALRTRAVAAAAAGVIGARTRERLGAVLEDACRRVLRFDAFFLLGWDEERCAFCGCCDTPGGDASFTPAAGTPDERVVRERRTLVTLSSDDPDATCVVCAQAHARRPQSSIRTPIVHGDGVLGILALHSDEPDLYTAEDVEMVEAMASLAATALVNIGLLEERAASERALRLAEREAHDMASRMRAVAAAAAGVIGADSVTALQNVLREACTRVVPFDAFTFGLYDPATETLSYLEGWDAGIHVNASTIPIAGVPSERVVRERRSLLTLSSEDPEGHGAILMGTGRRSESVIRTPILSGHEVLGVIALHSYTPGQYGERDVELVEAVASLAATALLNIRLAGQRTATEAALRSSEASYRALFDLSNDAIYVHYCETFDLIEVNRKACELHGWTAGEFLRLGLKAVDPGVGPYTLESAREFLTRAAHGEPQLFEWLARHRDGRHFFVEVSLRRVMINGRDRLLATARNIEDRKRARAALESAYAELETRVEERTAELARMNDALRQAKEEAERAREAAEAANRAKSEFLSRMSHELRTPMNSILGFGQLLARRDLPAEQRRGVDHILKAGQHLLNLINEVLDLARIEANRDILALEPVHLDTELRDAINLVRPLSVQGNCVIADDPAVDAAVPDALWVMADRQRLAQVILNILSNAVKYNRPGGRVWITCDSPRDDRVRIGIHDTGRGIPADRIDELFVPFSRLGAEDSGVVGTGLGLALSRRLVEAMGGTLSADSVFGEGSTFWVELERASSPPQRRASDRRGTGTPDPTSRRAAVLCIEDNVANLSLVEAVLALRPGITLLSALQGRIGFDLAVQHTPALILLDVNLPDVPGIDVLRRLRLDPRTGRTPVIVISADANPDSVRLLMDAGARAYITTPIDVEEFLSAVDSALAATS